MRLGDLPLRFFFHLVANLVFDALYLGIRHRHDGQMGHAVLNAIQYSDDDIAVDRLGQYGLPAIGLDGIGLDGIRCNQLQVYTHLRWG